MLYEVITPSEAAELKGISYAVITSWCRRGWLKKARRSGSRWLIDKSELIDFVPPHPPRIRAPKTPSKMPAMITTDVVTVEEAAQLKRVCIHTILNWCHRGLLKEARRAGHIWLIGTDELVHFRGRFLSPYRPPNKTASHQPPITFETITVPEASQLKAVPPRTIQLWCRRGWLKKARKTSHSWLISRSELMDFDPSAPHPRDRPTTPRARAAGTPTGQVITAVEAAQLKGVCVKTILRWCRDGLLKQVRKAGPLHLITTSELMDLKPPPMGPKRKTPGVLHVGGELPASGQIRLPYTANPPQN